MSEKVELDRLEAKYYLWMSSLIPACIPIHVFVRSRTGRIDVAVI
jgi:hypothetical protein